MRIILTLTSILFLLNFSYSQGNNCAAANSNQVTLPYNGTGLTNCGSGNTYTNACGSTLYQGGEDLLIAFTPTTTGQIDIDLTSTSSYVGLMLFQGCPTSGNCVASSNTSSGNQSIANANVTAGVTYYIMVDSWPAPSCHPNFNLSISSVTPPPPPATNDDPCSAFALPVSTTCTYATYSNTGATATSGVPAPGCASYSTGDVWFTAVVPASGAISFDSEAGSITDAGMAVYSAASCSGPFTLMDCDDDGSANGAMSATSFTGLTPGQTLYVRFWDYSDGFGTFGICAQEPPTPPSCSGNPPAGNTCATATPICDLNGYCGNTVTTTYSSNTWAQLSTAFCGSIENNSFISFVAESTSISFNVWTQNCTLGWGIQIFIFEDSNCGGPLDNTFTCWNPGTQTDATVSATGLTPGNTYYIMVDGNSGDVCDYIIGANTGISVPVDAGPDVSICVGQSTDLTATGGNGSYTWTPSGTLSSGSGATVTATPGTTTTYTATSATGNPLCPASTSDDVTVTVNSGGNLNLSGTSALSGSVGPSSNLSIDICNGGSAALTVAGGTTYTWSPATGLSSTSGASVTANPTTTTTYTVTSTNASGCPFTGQVTVNVTPAPTVTVNSGTICAGSNIVLNASGMNTYSWSPATGLSGTTGASVTASPTSTTVYTVTGSTAGCPNDTETSTVTVNPLPVPNFSTTGNQCLATNSVTFTNTGTAGTYSWSVTGGTPSTGAGNSITSTFATAGTFNVTLTTTVGTCVNSITIPVTINPNPTVSITPTQISCNGACDGQVVAAGAGTSGYSYNWGAPLGTGATKTGLCAGPYNVTVTDINGCTATASTTLTQPTALTVSTTPTDVLCNGVCNGSITSSGSGGTGTITYSWTGGLTGQNPTSVCDGTYTVTATDANLCTATAIATVAEPPLLTVSATPTAASCNGTCDGSITSSGSGGTGAISYTWTGGLSGQNPTGVCDGTYTVTATDANLCTATANATVTEPTLLTASIVSQTNVLCNGASTGSVTIGGAGSTGTYNYNIGGGPQVSGTFTGLSAGSYTVTVSDASNPACNTTVNVTITEPAALSASIAPVAVACNGDCDGQATVTPGGGSGAYTYSWDNTSFDATATTLANLCASTYNVTVADAASPTCTVNASITVTQPTAITLTPATTPANCGVSDGTASVVASGGSGVYTNYQWTPAPGAGQGTAAATGLAAGAYTVVVTDNNGCTQSIIINVANNTAPTISEVMASHIDVDCFGASTGAAEVSGSGGTGILTYSWSPAGGSATTASGLPAGTYTVTVTDANTCSDAVTVTITEPTVLNAVATVTANATCNGAADGSVSVSVSGGTVTYGYQWLDGTSTPIGGATSSTLTGLVAGAYSVQITDGNGCTLTSNIINITEPVAVSGSGTETPVLCNGGNTGSIDFTPAGGDGNYTYAWTGPGAFTSNVQDPAALLAGTYNVTITDGNGCTGTASVTVTEPSLMTLSASGNDAHCAQADGDVTATGANGTGTITYEWFSDAGFTASIGTGANLGSLLAGTYYVVATDANGCTISSPVTIGDLAGPTVAAVVNSDATGPGLCNGNGTATGSGGTGTLTYLWDNSNTNATAADLCQGSNCVTVTDAAGCTDTDCITINEPTGVTVVIAPTHLLCNAICNGAADVTATGGVGGYTYVWAHGPTAEDLTGLCAGTYDVSVTDANGNTGVGSVTITEPTAINITSSTATTNSCNGACDGSVDATAIDGTAPLSFEWFDAASASVGTSANITNLCAGAYDLIVTDGNGCTSTVSEVVTEPAVIALTPANTSSNCGQSDGSVSVTAAGGTITTDYIYSWSDATPTVIGSTASITNLLAGVYTVIVTDDNGCSETTTATVTDLGGATLTETHINTNCNGSSDGSINLTVTGGTPTFTYAWTGPNSFTATSQDLSTLSAGTYDVTVTDAVNCISTMSITITEPSVITITPASIQAVCFGGSTGSVSASATGGTGAITFNWFDDVVLSNNIGTGISISNLAAGTYYVSATDGNGCTSNNSVIVTEPDVIAVTVTSVDANCGQADGSIAVTNTTGGSGVYVSTEWFDGASNPVIDENAVNSGTYNVLVTDDLGCTGTATIGVNDLTGPSVSLISAASVSCNGLCDGTALVTTSGGTPGYTYNWTPAPGGGQGTDAAIGLCAGNYTATVTDANGCIDNIVVNIVEPAPLNVTITNINDVTINGASDGDVTSSTTGGTPAYTYEWYNGCPPGAILGQQTSNASGLSVGDYSVIVTDAKGCLDTACATVNEPTTINIVEVIVNTSCFNGCDGTISITATGGVPGYSYEWYDASTNVAIGQNGNNATSLCAGDYYVIVEDQNGASQTSSTYTVGQPTQISIATSVTSNFNGADISCFGLCNGVANAVPSGGTGPYLYAWDAAAGNQATATANGLCDGTYSVTITDNNGCTQVENITLTQPTAVTNTPSQTNVSCNAACDGEVVVSPTGGTGTYTYLWNDPALSTTATVSSLCANTYNVTISDANGCSVNPSYTITEPVALVLNSSTQGSNCGQNDGSASVTIVSGVAPFTYLWDANAGSAATATASNLFAGCYDVTVTDANGCSQLLNICVQDLGAPTVTLLTQTNVSCNGGNNGFAQIQVTDGIAPYVYNWTDCSGTPIGQTTASAFTLTAGCYTGTMVDNVGCTGSVNVTITEPTVLNSIISSSTDVSCFGFCDGTATVTAGGGTAPYTYSWNDAANQTTATASNLCPGTYSVDVTDFNGCQQTLNVTITEPAEIILSTSDVDAFCNTNTGSATVTITSGGVGPFDYLWTPGGQTTSTATNLSPNTYNVQVIDADGCIQNASATVGNILPGTATIGTINNVSCFGGANGSIDVSMSGTGTAPYIYQWHTSGGTPLAGQTNPTSTGLIAGDYYVEVTDANGCVSISNIDIVTEPTQLTASTIQTDALCFNACDGTADALAVGGTQPYTYLWNDALNQTTITASGLCDGTYAVQVTDNNGCIVSANATIGEPTIISIDSTVTNANCGQPDGQACVLASGGAGGYTYLWPSGGTNSCEINLAASTYIVSVFDQNSCEQQISVEVQDLGGPVASITGFTDVSCNAFCDGQATVDMTSGNGSSFTVQWDANAGNQTTPTASNLCAGNYAVTITDDLGCNASTSVTIGQPDLIQYNITPQNTSCFAVCDGQAQITVIGGTLPYTYSWLDNLNNPIGGNTNTVTGLCNNNFGINVIDANGCTFTDNFVIQQPMQVDGNIIPQNITCFGACDGIATASATEGFAPFTYTWDAATGNQTGAPAQNLCPGTYVVTITDDHGCSNTVSTTLTEPTLLTSNISLNGNVTCNGFCDGFAEISGAGGSAPYNFSWNNNGGQSQLATNLCAGNYTGTITDANGCISTSTITITQPQPLSATTNVTNNSCYNSCNGSGSVSAAGGTAPYTYQWDNSNFATTSSFSNECAGTYTVVVTDVNGCQISKTITITQPNPIISNVNITNSNCGQDNGQICTSTNGGTAPYSYQWNDPNTQTGACALNLFAGCVTFTVTDANACVMDTLICLNDIAGPTVAGIASSHVTCFGADNGSVEFSVSGGSGIVVSEILDGSGANVTTGTIAGSLNGDCYTLIATDAAGCIATDVLCVNEPNQLNSAVTQSTPALCNAACNGTATASANGGTLPYAYSWNGGLTPNSNYTDGLCAGTYTVTITDGNNCTSQSNIAISEPLPIVITDAITDVNCFSGSDGVIDITVTGGTQPYLYDWSPSGQTTSDLNQILAGNYSVFILDANSCDATANYTVNQPTAINITVNSLNNPTCEQCNGQITVTASGGVAGYTYLWDNGATPNSNSNTGFCPGPQDVVVTDSHGCTMTITENLMNQASPQIDSIVGVNPSCNGLSNGNATVFASGVFDPNTFTYLWDAASNGQTSQTANALGDGVYCVTVTDPNGCTASQCTNIIEPSPLNAVPDGSTTICYGEDTQVWASGQGGTAPYTITWTTAGMTGTGPILVNPLVSTDYCFRVTDNNGCLSPTACVEILVREPLTLDITPSTFICANGSIDVSAIGTGGDATGYTFDWVNGANQVIPDVENGNESTITVAPTTATWYYVTFSDGCSIDAIDSTEISVSPNPVAFLSAADSNGCEPFNALFIGNSDIGVTYEFDVDCDGVYEYSGANSNFNYTFNNEGIYDVCMNVISADGCASLVSNPGLIEVYPLPVANFIPDPENTTFLTPYITFNDNSTGGVTYDWNFGDNNTMTGGLTTVYNNQDNTTGPIIAPLHTFSDTGYYDVTLTIETEYGCISTYTQTVYIEGDYSFYTPNAFTPDGDGRNDTFKPLGIGIDRDDYEFYIFNRWGQLIFEGYDPDDEWDGTYQNVMSQQDVYVWKIRTRDHEGQPQDYIGHVTLVR